MRSKRMISRNAIVLLCLVLLSTVLIAQNANNASGNLTFANEGIESPYSSSVLFVVHGASSTISQLEPSTGAILHTIPTPEPTSAGPEGLAFDGTSLFFVNALGTNTIFELDPATGAVLNSFPAPDSGGIDALAHSGVSLFGLCVANNTVFEIDPPTGIVINSFHPSFRLVGGMTFGGSRGSLFITENFASIHELDPSTGALINSLPVPEGSVYGLGYSDDLRMLFASTSTGTIFALDPNDGTVVNSFSVQGIPSALAADEITVLQGPQIRIIPKSLNFEKIFVDKTSLPMTVIIRNIGTEVLTVTDISDPGSSFSLSNLPSLPESIPPGASEHFEVAFSPTSAGIVNATFTIRSSDPDDPTVDVMLSGDGIVFALAESVVCYASTGRFRETPGSLLTIDPVTGAGTLLASTSLDGIPGLAINSRGEMFASDGGNGGDLYRIDAENGEVLLVGNTGLRGLDAIAFDGKDELYGVDETGTLYKIDTRDGETTLIGKTGENVAGMAFDPIDGTLWASTGGSRPNVPDGIYKIDPTTGAPAFVGTTGLGGATPDIHFDSAGILFGVKGGGSRTNVLIFIDKVTGTGSVIGRINVQAVSGLAFRPGAAPAGSQIRVIPGSINFGKILMGDSSSPRTIIINSIGTEDLTVNDITALSPLFSLSNLPLLPVAIPPGVSETFEVKFSPTGKGMIGTPVKVSSNDSDDSAVTIILSGEGIDINFAEFDVCYASTGGNNIHSGSLLTIDLANGAGTLVGSTGFEVVPGLAINSRGELFGTTPGLSDLIRIDGLTGNGLIVGNTGAELLRAIAFDEFDDLYGIAFNGDLMTLDIETGAPKTIIAKTEVTFVGMAFDPKSGTLWASNGEGADDPDGIYVVDKITGAATKIGETGLGGPTRDILFDANGRLFGVKGSGQANNFLISINTSNGFGRVIGLIGFSNVSGLAFRQKPLEGPQIRVNPESLDFERVLVGGGSSSKMVTINNIGSEDLDITGISEPGAQFSLVNRLDLLLSLIPPKGFATLQVTFSPTIPGVVSRIIAINSNDEDDPTINITVAGEGKDPAPTGTVLFVVDGSFGTISQLDPVTGAMLNTIPTPEPASGGPDGLAFDGTNLFFVNGTGTNTIFVLDPATGNILNSFPAPESGGLDALAYSGYSLFGLCVPNNTIIEIDPTTGFVINSFAPSFRLAGGMTFGGSRGTLFTTENFVAIVELDPTTGTLINRFPSPEGSVFGLGYSNNFNVLYTGTSDSTIFLLDPDNGMVNDSLSVTRIPSGLAADELVRFEGRRLSVIPRSIDFGRVLVGNSSSARTIFIGNIGAENLAVTDISDPGVPFSLIDLPTLPVAIQSKKSKTFELMFSPITAGVANAVIRISNDAPNVPTTEIGLMGEGAVLNIAEPGICYASTGGLRDTPGSLLTIDPVTGAGTLLGSTGLDGVPGLAINSRGEIFGTGRRSGDLYRIDAATGEAVFVTSTGLGVLDAIAFDRNDVLYGIDSFSTGELYIIDTVTGEPTLIGVTGDIFTGMAFDPTDGTLWASTGGVAGVADAIYKIDRTTGAATLVGTTGLRDQFGDAIPDIHFDDAGILFGLKGGGSRTNVLISVNKSTGAGTVIGPIGFNAMSGLAFRPKSIIPGDVTGDGEVDINDLIRTINIILNVEPPPTEAEKAAADVNGDGKIDVNDLIGIINIILGVG